MNIIKRIIRFTERYGKIFYHHYPYETIAKIIRENNFKSYAEVGVWQGKTLFNIAKMYPGTHCIGIDPFTPSSYKNYHHCDKMAKQSKDQFSKIEYKVKWTASNYSNVELMVKTSIQASKQIKDNTIDMVFIDGNHDYNNTSMDIKAWLPKVKKGGVLCGHDYNTKHFAVIKAVDKCLGCDNVLIIEGSSMWVYRKK